MTTLPVLSLVYYLTTAGEGGPAWREQDWTANRIIKSVKGETIKGWFTVRLRTRTRRFDERTKDELVTLICGSVARKLVTLSTRQLCIVPIPNSSAASADRRPFRTMELATKIAELSDGRATVTAALRWKRRLVPTHRGGPRDPAVLLDNLVLVQRPDRVVVLFDDVLTSGGHMVACYRRLHAEKLSPIAALVIGRATPVQQPKMLGWQEELLPVDEAPFELDF